MCVLEGVNRATSNCGIRDGVVQLVSFFTGQVGIKPNLWRHLWFGLQGPYMPSPGTSPSPHTAGYAMEHASPPPIPPHASSRPGAVCELRMGTSSDFDLFRSKLTGLTAITKKFFQVKPTSQMQNPFTFR